MGVTGQSGNGPATTNGVRTYAGRRALAAGVWLLLLAGHASAQGNEDWHGDWQPSPSTDACSPKCRRGFRCQLGECVPVCNPPCADGALCTESGECVRLLDQAQDRAPRRAERCEPRCRSGFVCLHGQCVSACNPPCASSEVCAGGRHCIPRDRAQAAPPAETPAAAPPPEAQTPGADSLVALHLNALGPLQFGVDPTIELGTTVSGFVRLRFLNTGLGSYVLLPGAESVDFAWGLGTALGLHVFSSSEGHMRGFFGGAALEYVYTENQDTSATLAEFRTHLLIPELDLGYRWALDRFLLGLGLGFGLALPVYAEDEPLTGDVCRIESNCRESRHLYFLVNLLLDIGWYF